MQKYIWIGVVKPHQSIDIVKLQEYKGTKEMKTLYLSIVICLSMTILAACSNMETIKSDQSNAKFAATQTTTTYSKWPPDLVEVGKWNISSFPGMENVAWFDEKEFAPWISTIDTSNINGRDYLVLSFRSNHGNGSSLLVIYDLADSSSPSFISSFIHPEEEYVVCAVKDIAIKDGILYAGLFGDLGLWIVDISNPAAPIELGIAPIKINENIVAFGNYVLGTGQLHSDLVICDVSDPRDIVEVKRLAIGSGERCLTVDGNLLFVANKGYLSTYDISSPENARWLSGYQPPVPEGLTTQPEWYNYAIDWSNWATARGIQASDNYVYLTFGAGGVRVIDVSIPTTPREVASIDVDGFAISLTLNDNLLFVCKAKYEVKQKELTMLDVSEPEKPALLSMTMTGADFNISGIIFNDYWMPPELDRDAVFIPATGYLGIFKLE